MKSADTIAAEKAEMLEAAKALDLAEEAVKVANSQRMELYYAAREARDFAITRLQQAVAVASRY